MTAVQFYHLTATPLERALPKLLEKAYAGGFKTLLVAESEERAEKLNELLWTYDPNSFLPHGNLKDGHAEEQPILISTSVILGDAKHQPGIHGENDATKRLLLVTNGMTPEKPEAFERVLDMFDGRDPQAVESARARWTYYKNAGHSITYMKQTESGGWEKV